MPRPKKNRKISHPPLMQGFKPFGIPRNRLGAVTLLYDEYEAIRLLVCESGSGCGRTFPDHLTRIYEQLENNCSALVEGQMINIEGENVLFDKSGFVVDVVLR